MIDLINSWEKTAVVVALLITGKMIDAFAAWLRRQPPKSGGGAIGVTVSWR
jgi:hypothetical protein